MRGTKYRGWSKDCNNWVYGSLIEKGIFEEHRYYEIFSVISGSWVVEKESIGQFTGIKDDIDNEIYEKDICRVDDKFCKIIWNKDGCRFEYEFEYSRNQHAFNLTCDTDIRKVGTLFENAELLA